jgi:mannose-6-phosphate isomerase-like protein (cupin superfamily)
VYIRVINFVQPAGHTFPSKTHVPGFDYVASGVQRLTIAGTPPVDMTPGKSVFQPSVAHTHTNPGVSPNNWYFIALWPAAARTEALVDPKVAKVVFETPDLPADALPPGSYVQTLRVVDLQPSGRGAAHRYGGVDVQFVLEGSISVHIAGQQPVTLRAGEGAYYLPDAGLQEHNSGDRRARFLEMLTTGGGRPFETTLDHAP